MEEEPLAEQMLSCGLVTVIGIAIILALMALRSAPLLGGWYA